MANNDCLPQVMACRLRVCKLDSNGVPSPGANKLYVTDAFASLTATPVYVDADEIEEKNGCGEVAINYKGDDSFKRLDVELQIHTHDPYLAEMLGLGTVLTSGGVNGYAVPPIGALTGNGVSVEVWAKRIDSGALHAEYPYAWWVLPKVQNLRHGTKTFNNGAHIQTFTGQAVENENWYDGPLNNWPVASDRALQWFPTASMPAVVCGPQTVTAS